jgi:hypothetical protein
MRRSIYVFILIWITISIQAQQKAVSDSIINEDTKLLKEVVVSVQKRNQSSLEVPVAVNALSGGDLLRLDVRQFDEL